MNIQDLLLGPAEDLEVESLDEETLFALATCEANLDVATSAILELGGRPSAATLTLEATGRLLTSAWADKHLKSAALDAAFRADPRAAGQCALDALRTTREPLLLDAMIRGSMTDVGAPAPVLEELQRRLRVVAATVSPDAYCDHEAWQEFLQAPAATSSTVP